MFWAVLSLLWNILLFIVSGWLQLVAISAVIPEYTIQVLQQVKQNQN